MKITYTCDNQYVNLLTKFIDFFYIRKLTISSGSNKKVEVHLLTLSFTISLIPSYQRRYWFNRYKNMVTGEDHQKFLKIASATNKNFCCLIYSSLIV